MKLIKELPHILKTPYPLDFHPARITTGVLIFGLFVFLFLYTFKPFGLQHLSGTELLKITSGYGMVTTAYLVAHWIIMVLFLREKDWTAGKDIVNTLIIIAMIGLCNYFYHSIYFTSTFSFVQLLKIQLETLAVSFIPVTIGTLLRQYFLLKKYLRDAEVINKGKEQVVSGIRMDQAITITAQNPKNDFTCNGSDILCLHAMDNYVVVHYTENSEDRKEIIRTTLKKAMENLGGDPNFFHCHKSYIVNLHRVSKTSGNAQGLKLHMDSGKETIPVSRQYHKEFKALFV
jgi:DNA-binding LytR/AlgR family response regulator